MATAKATFFETMLDSPSGITSEKDGSSRRFKTYFPVSLLDDVLPQVRQGSAGESVGFPHHPQIGASFTPWAVNNRLETGTIKSLPGAKERCRGDSPTR